MWKRRTDLAMEARDLWRETAGEGEPAGVDSREQRREGYPVTTVEIKTEDGARSLGRPVGRYVTVDLSQLAHRERDAFGRAVRAVSGELKQMLPLGVGAGVLVVGLGNRAITPDAIGPKVADFTLVTRHMVSQAPELFASFRPVAALAAGVLGTTGMESGELVSAAVERVKPAAVIAVDALAARSMDRVCTTVQIADTGIVPGSGVGNHRQALDQETLGVPVVAVGVPTVVEAATLCADLLERSGVRPPALDGAGEGLIVTPRDIDAQVQELSRIIGFGINLALQPHLAIEDIELLLS